MVNLCKKNNNGEGNDSVYRSAIMHGVHNGIDMLVGMCAMFLCFGSERQSNWRWGFLYV